jgi:hypothetical protein
MMGLLEALMTCTNKETHLMMGMGGNIRADARNEGIGGKERDKAHQTERESEEKCK